MSRRWIIPFLLLFACCYYGSYYRCSLYPAGEGGLEGTIALRLLEGKIPFLETALSYNLFWFYPIVALFKIFGPSYTILRIFFFCVASCTGLLIFHIVSSLTKRLLPAILAAILALLLPGQLFRNYMAFLVVLNMALFLKAFLSYQSTLKKRLLWIGATGLALSGTFLIRIDLGFFLSFLFCGLAPLFPWINSRKQTASFGIRSLLLSCSALFIGATTFLAFHFPIYTAASHRGFASYFSAQYQQWPHMIALQGARLFQRFSWEQPPLSSVTSSPPPSSSLQSPQPAPAKTTLLRRSLFSSDIREQITALNLYLPIATSGLLLLMAIGFLCSKKNPFTRQRAFQLLTSLGCSLTLFPQYFFWRPDMVHLSEFMVPMSATIIIGLVFAYEAWPSAHTIFKLCLGSFAIIGSVTLLLYLINGCQSQSTGGIAIREGRTQEFVGKNGVHVKLKPSEWQETWGIYQSILQHSQPGEYVICFPYNPEINFMTDRPSYRYDLYCDDVTAPKYFDQVAIQEIETFHPAVIVINNWPINGSDHSRFKNWATPTYSYIQSHYTLDFLNGIIEVYTR